MTCNGRFVIMTFFLTQQCWLSNVLFVVDSDLLNCFCVKGDSDGQWQGYGWVSVCECVRARAKPA